MTPGARVAAAIAVLDRIIAGEPAEQALTGWARGSRFAGSGDRAAVRDHVFDVLRAKRSLGDGDGRSLMLRLAQREGWDIPALFSGQGHAPAPATQEELAPLPALSPAAACDIPDWLWPDWCESLGEQAVEVAQVQQQRAEVFLRLNTRRSDQAGAIAALAADGITAVPHPNVATCLRITENPRRLRNSAAFTGGLVELQDSASQDAIARLPLDGVTRILDYCAGGGGKALALADRSDAAIFAHDIAPERMRDLPARAARAGVTITLLDPGRPAQEPPFDLVFCDAPCSGSGTWRRTPDAKWRLTPERLAELTQMQAAVLDSAAPLVAPGGLLAYATCAVLTAENAGAVQRFLDRRPDFRLDAEHHWLPGPDGDGFYLALLERRQNNS